MLIKRLLLTLLLSFIILGCKSQNDKNDYKIGVSEFKQGTELNEIQLIDVRTPKEYKEGHIGNAENIDFLANDFTEKIKTLDKSKPVYIYCKSGNRSGKATKALYDAGFNTIYDLEGGILAWEKENNIP